jgi:hypothetical protein
VFLPLVANRITDTGKFQAILLPVSTAFLPVAAKFCRPPIEITSVFAFSLLILKYFTGVIHARRARNPIKQAKAGVGNYCAEKKSPYYPLVLEAQGYRSLSLPKEGNTPSLTIPAFHEDKAPSTSSNRAQRRCHPERQRKRTGPLTDSLATPTLKSHREEAAQPAGF